MNSNLKTPWSLYHPKNVLYRSLIHIIEVGHKLQSDAIYADYLLEKVYIRVMDECYLEGIQSIWVPPSSLSYHSNHSKMMLLLCKVMLSWLNVMKKIKYQFFQSRKRLYIHKCPLVTKPLNSLKSSSFIIHHSSLTFFINSSFISRLLSFSACFFITNKSYSLQQQ